MRRQFMAAAASLACAAGTAGAQVFDNGLPAGYTCTGTCATAAPNGVVTAAPGGGARFGYITTFNAPAQDPLGVDGTTNGSVLRSSAFTTNAGQSLSFAFNYVTSDGSPDFPDYAYVRLINTAAPGSPLTLFTARTTPTGNTVPGFGLPGIAPGVTLTPASTPIIDQIPVFSGLGDDSGECFRGVGQGCGYTGWIGVNYVVGATGSYQLEFGVFNFSDQLYESALAFDFSTGQGGTPEQPGPGQPGVVPEPSTYALMGMGLAGVAGLARRRRRAA